MNNQERCAIKTLKLFNFRCFEELNINFNEHLSVFVAPNGCGKTAILDAVAVSLRLFPDTIEERPNSKGFDARDIRLVLNPLGQMEQVTPVRFEAYGRFFDRCIKWSRERRSEKSSRTTTTEAQGLRSLAEKISKQNKLWAQKKETVAPIFPVIAYYGTGRLWANTRISQKKSKVQALTARHRGYSDCLSSSSHYRYFFEWFGRHAYSEKHFDEVGNNPGLQNPFPIKGLDSVRSAVDIALKPVGWHNLAWDFKEDLVVASHDLYGTLPAEMLSDGIRNMVGLVADLAHRVVRLNPQLEAEAHLKTPGIVLIDEVDMHLHPQWQQHVLQSLQKAFPMVQFIVTTHSPQVLSTVAAENIFMVEQSTDGNWLIAQPDRQTQGVESSRVMAEVMRTDQTPAMPITEKLSEYYMLIQTLRYASESALKLRKQLIVHYGENAPEIQEADRMIGIEKFKQSLKETDKGD